MRDEILKAEEDFQQMVIEKGIQEAFYFFADENAVIKRGNDTLIKGKENIKTFYSKYNGWKMELNWTPEFIDVAECGTLGYTYGRYVMTVDSVKDEGVFHTVWKRQPDKTWKYVWD
ncbi:MAG TPA: hypothetical protein VHO50_07860 [Bacteroidales bacterium]|nr:hypothetical protein [Bacteroidales bacterium]